MARSAPGFKLAVAWRPAGGDHRRYRITEGSEEIQMRKVAGNLFGYTGGQK